MEDNYKELNDRIKQINESLQRSKNQEEYEKLAQLLILLNKIDAELNTIQSALQNAMKIIVNDKNINNSLLTKVIEKEAQICVLRTKLQKAKLNININYFLSVISL